MRVVHQFSREEKSAYLELGDWLDEPDEVIFKHKGITCYIKRNQVGALCGYCKLPKDHAYYGKHYYTMEYNVHGGFTFGKVRKNGDHWIGFDCCHAFDLTPLKGCLCRPGLWERLTRT